LIQHRIVNEFEAVRQGCCYIHVDSNWRNSELLNRILNCLRSVDMVQSS